VTHRVIFTERAAKDIAGLDRTTRERIGRALRRLETEPRSKSRQLTQPALGTFRYRIGDFRVIFDIEGDEVVILRVGHRSIIYR
jgi:mRNA interferase RelE/StbE